MVAVVSPSLAARKAVKWFDENRGSLCRSNSTAYRNAVERILRAANPQREAETLIGKFIASKSRGDDQAIKQCVKGDRGAKLPEQLIPAREVTTADLDELVAFVRSRFGGRLDPTHHALFARMEAAIFARQLTSEQFIEGGRAALKVALFEPRKGTWTCPA